MALTVSRGGSATYLFAIPISLALKLLEIPDPSRPFPENRRVKREHAVDFGNYWETHEGGWVVPPLLLDCTDAIIARSTRPANAIGTLVEIDLPEDRHGSMRILDGQHRILGWFLKRQDIDVRVANATSAYNKAVIGGARAAAEEAREQIALLKLQMERFDSESIAINLIDLLDAKKHQQFFVDIAKNALGINKTVQAKFDSGSIVNRVAQHLISNHELLVGRIDLEKTSCSGSNPNLLTVVNIADIVRHVCFGIGTRVTARREISYRDENLMSLASEFFDLMVQGFPQLKDVHSRRITPSALRANSLLGSGTIWRCLAGAFHKLCVVEGGGVGLLAVQNAERKMYAKMLSELSTCMQLPISREWFSTNLFPAKTSKAPSSRTQDLGAMVDLLAAWARCGQPFNPKNVRGL